MTDIKKYYHGLFAIITLAGIKDVVYFIAIRLMIRFIGIEVIQGFSIVVVVVNILLGFGFIVVIFLLILQNKKQQVSKKQRVMVLISGGLFLLVKVKDLSFRALFLLDQSLMEYVGNIGRFYQLFGWVANGIHLILYIGIITCLIVGYRDID